MAGIEVRAVARHLRISPQKVRLVLDTIRGKPVDEALNILRFLPHKATEPVAKVFSSASANAENNFNLDPDQLVVAARVRRRVPHAEAVSAASSRACRIRY